MEKKLALKSGLVHQRMKSRTLGSKRAGVGCLGCPDKKRKKGIVGQARVGSNMWACETSGVGKGHSFSA